VGRKSGGAYSPLVPALELTDLRVRYGARTAVDGLSLTAPTGAVTALVGPNGAGKTSTVEVCVGLRRADSGRVEVLGTEVSPLHLTSARRSALAQRVGMMLQDGGLYPTARPLEMVQQIGRMYDDPDDAHALLEALGVNPATRTPLKRLSGGEQRRVAAAAALIGRPELVFLDEPTTGLDPAGRRTFHDLLLMRVAEGTSVVLTTHLLDDVERLADHVVVMAAGRAVAAGSVDSLVGDDNTMTFRGPFHLDLQSLRAALPDGSTVDEGEPGSYRVTGPLDPLALSTITAWCGQHGVATRDLRLGRRALEDVVIDLTEGSR